jgi:hypothetical protein
MNLTAIDSERGCMPRRAHHPTHTSFTYWHEYYAAQRIELLPLPRFDRYIRNGGYHATVSHHAMEWLAAREFDVVHFADWQGHGYSTILAKHNKQTAFANTTVVLMTHGPLRWARESNEQARRTPPLSCEAFEPCFGMSPPAHATQAPFDSVHVTRVLAVRAGHVTPSVQNSLLSDAHGCVPQVVESAEDLEVDRMEQQSIMHAQVLVSPSAYLLSWIISKGWALPSHSQVYVQPYIMPQEARRAIAEAVAASQGAR